MYSRNALSANGDYIPVTLHVSGALTTGVKVPKFIAPVAMTVVNMYAVCNAGSGVACRPSKNAGTTDGTEKTSITTSAVSQTQSVSLAAGDRLTVNVTNAGSSASDLSVTFWVRVN